MSENTGIEWCDHTFNPWWGCVRVSPACEHCYAETFARRVGHRVWGVQADRRFFGDKHWDEPLKWNRAAQADNVRKRVFCASMADVFEDRRELDEHRDRLWDLIDRTPALEWLLLTKRPQHARQLTPWGRRWPENVWLGTTAEDQRRADERIPFLLDVPVKVRFVSAEPLLGPVDFGPYLQRLHWVILGGESGAGARSMDLAWARGVRDQVRGAGIPLFFKQWGQHAQPNGRGDQLVRVRKKNENVFDGEVIQQFPDSYVLEPEPVVEITVPKGVRLVIRHAEVASLSRQDRAKAAAFVRRLQDAAQ